MGKAKLSLMFKNVQSSIAKHSPEILTGIGIAGMITSTVFAVKATPRAIKLCDELKRERMNSEQYEEPTKFEYVKACWKCYIPTAVTGATSIACLIGANSVHARRSAALATAYKISETAFTEYKDKVIETIGEKKEKTIRERIDKERIEKNPVSNNQIVITDKGTTLCYDPISGRYFKSDIERIKKTQNELNKRMLEDMFGYIALNEFYDEIGLENISIGEDLGWNVNRGLIDIDFTSQIADNGEPSIVLEYRVAPRYDYSKV